MKIRFLGTGAGYPDPQRNSSSILLEGINGGLLIDCGEGTASRLQETNQWSQVVYSIILTHNHADHVSGLAMLLQGWKRDWEFTGKREIIAPRIIKEKLLDYLTMVRLSPESLKFDLVIRELKEGNYQSLSGLEFYAWPNGHLLVDHEKRGGSYSLKMNLKGKKVLFSSDIPSLDAIKAQLVDTDILVVEASHVDYQEVIEAAEYFGLKDVYFTHISKDFNCPEHEKAVWAYDNLLIEI